MSDNDTVSENEIEENGPKNDDFNKPKIRL